MSFTLPELLFDYNALEPHIDAQTMEIHHSKHHAGYTNNLNAALAGSPQEGESIESILSQVSKLSAAVRNNGGGFYNHGLFWENLSPNGGGKPTGDLLAAIERDFGSSIEFQEIFNKAAATRFGSGWAWLIKQGAQLKVVSTPNQDNPMMDLAEEKGTILLALDVWEHAYYLKYQNRRPDYIGAFWNVVAWGVIGERFKK